MKRAIIFLVLAVFAVAVHAQQNSFIDRFLELRQPTETEGFDFTILNKEDIQAISIEIEAEEERLRAEKFWANVKQFAIFLDMGGEGSLTISQINDLLSAYDELLLMATQGLNISFKGAVKNDKIEEVVIFVNGGNRISLLSSILFETPITLQDFIDDSQNIEQLISFNYPEDDNTFIGIGIDAMLLQMMTSTFFNNLPAFPGFCDIPITIEVVQVDGKYSIRTTGATFFGRDRLFTTKPRIYGSNPGNTYVVTVSENGVAILYDRYGQWIAMARDFTPVYVLGSEEEIAAFIFRESSLGYSLFETPEIYTAITANTGNSISIAPRREFRISKEAQSITPTEDGYLRVVMEDGAVEYIPIRRQATNQ